MAYLLDADVLISAKNLHYGFDICPGFWDWLIQANEQGRVFSVERVGGQIRAGNDDLAKWGKERGDSFFVRSTPGLVAALGTVANWANDQSYQAAAITTFLRDPDYYFGSIRRCHGLRGRYA